MSYRNHFCPNELAGHKAAETWFIDMTQRAAAAQGYFVPSLLRETYAALPSAERNGFIDAIGALLVLNEVSGDPAVNAIDLTEDVYLQSLPPSEQDSFNPGGMQ